MNRASLHSARIGSWRVHRRVWLLCGMLAWEGFVGEKLHAQDANEPIVLRTDGGQSLVTAMQPFYVSPGIPMLLFNFAFATDETFQPGTIFDSFTITLQDAAGASILIYLTADAGGVAWAPLTPGSIFLDPESIIRSPIGFPGLGEVVPPYQLAYQVAAPIPEEFRGQTVNVFLDMFDNQNEIPSLGYFVIVPEPLAWSLGLLGIAVWAGIRKIRSCRALPHLAGNSRG